MSNVSSVFSVIEALQKIPGFNTSKNSYGRSWILNNGELGVFARNIIEQYEAEKAKELAKEKA
jgi:hypothetical protein